MDRRKFLRTLSLSAVTLLPGSHGQVLAGTGLTTQPNPAASTNRKVAIGISTTGLDPEDGHRIAEIAAIEIIGRQITGSSFHSYLNPERDSDLDFLLVHGLTRAILSDRPQFRDLAHEFVQYIENDALILHNAPFYLAFLDQEFSMAEYEFQRALFPAAIDTLEIAKQMQIPHPSFSNLCALFKITRNDGTGQLAFQDALASAQLYLAMTPETD